MMFAHMFSVPYFGKVCPTNKEDRNTWNCGNFWDSYLQSFSMFLTDGYWGFTDEYGFDDRFRKHKTDYYLTIFFAFIVGVLLLNIVIAEVSNRFTDVQNDAEKAFWLHRLSLVQEIESLCFQLKRYSTHSFCLCRKSANGYLQKEENTPLQRTLSTSSHGQKPLDNDGTGMERFCFLASPSYHEQERFQDDEELRNFTDWWFSTGDQVLVHRPNFTERMLVFYNYSQWDEVIFPGKVFERIFLGFKYNAVLSTEAPNMFVVLLVKIVAWIFFCVHIFVAVITFISGLFFGFLWPKPMKKWLFHGDIHSKEQSKDVSVQMEILQQQSSELQQQNRELKQHIRGLLEDNKILKDFLLGGDKERQKFRS